MAANPTIARVKSIYTSQIGIREKQPNLGPEVEKYLKYVNVPKGNPWCAAFVFWVYGRASVENPKTGWTPALFNQWHGTWLVTVEGNTNVSGGREGDGVYRKRRSVRSIYKVAR